MRSLVTEVIPERLGPVTADFPDASYKNEAAGVLPTPVLAQFMTSYHYSVLRFLNEAGLSINDLTDDINNNQFWDAYYANTNRFILENSGLSPIAPRLISGATRAASSMPDFLRANGASLEFTILGNTTNLVMSTNNKEFVTDQDIVVAGVTAAPGANNTADINDITIVNDLYAGEDGSELIIDAVGSEVSALVGQMVAFKTVTGEIFQGFLKTATLITNVFRGFYFDNSGNPIVRGNLSDNDTLTLMKIGYVFVEDNGTTIDVSYLTPVVSYTAPSGPATGQYWFDISNKVWKIYSGASFDIINRVLTGEVVSDSTNTIASRSYDFSNQFKELNNIELDIYSTEIVRSKSLQGRISVYGTEIQIDHSFLGWNIITDLESPLTEAVSTVYYLYISDEGQRIISATKPYWREDLKGDYHPYHSWRLVGMGYNDSSSNFTVIWSEVGNSSFVSGGSGTFSTTSSALVPITNHEVDILTRGLTTWRFSMESVAGLVGYIVSAGPSAGAGGTLQILSGADILYHSKFRIYTSFTAGTNCDTVLGFGGTFTPKLGVHTIVSKASKYTASYTSVGVSNATLNLLENAK